MSVSESTGWVAVGYNNYEKKLKFGIIFAVAAVLALIATVADVISIGSFKHVFLFGLVVLVLAVFAFTNISTFKSLKKNNTQLNLSEGKISRGEKEYRLSDATRLMWASFGDDQVYSTTLYFLFGDEDLSFPVDSNVADVGNNVELAKQAVKLTKVAYSDMSNRFVSTEEALALLNGETFGSPVGL